MQKACDKKDRRDATGDAGSNWVGLLTRAICDPFLPGSWIWLSLQDGQAPAAGVCVAIGCRDYSEADAVSSRSVVRFS